MSDEIPYITRRKTADVEVHFISSHPWYHVMNTIGHIWNSYEEISLAYRIMRTQAWKPAIFYAHKSMIAADLCYWDTIASYCSCITLNLCCMSSLLDSMLSDEMCPRLKDQARWTNLMASEKSASVRAHSTQLANSDCWKDFSEHSSSFGEGKPTVIGRCSRLLHIQHVSRQLKLTTSFLHNSVAIRIQYLTSARSNLFNYRTDAIVFLCS